MSAVPILFLLVDGTMKLLRPAVVVAGCTKLGYPPSTILPLGILLLACLAVHLWGGLYLRDGRARTLLL